MKKVLFLFGFLLLAGSSYATEDWNLGKSSWTTTNEGVVWIPNTYPGTVLWSVIVASSTGQGVLALYDSSATFNNLISSMSLAGAGNGAFQVGFEVRCSSGLSYKTTGNINGVTIVYKPSIVR